MHESSNYTYLQPMNVHTSTDTRLKCGRLQLCMHTAFLNKNINVQYNTKPQRILNYHILHYANQLACIVTCLYMSAVGR